MKVFRRFILVSLLLAGAGWWLRPTPSAAYVEAPMSFGSMVAQSTHIMLMRVEAVDKEKNIIIYRKILDLKGKHPQDVIKHNIGRGGLRPNEWKPQMDWAEPGRIAAFFHNGGASETCIGNWWYQAYAGGEWWNHAHGEPYLNRSFSGAPEKLAGIIPNILAGQEVVVPCMVNGNLEDLHQRRAKIQRVKASLKLLDYNPKRDFIGWGGEDFRRLQGWPGFTHISGLAKVEEPQAISVVDLNNDNKPDLCLVGAGKVVVLQNGGEAMSESPLPVPGGARAAVWADYNEDGKPDLFLATTHGPRLLTNLGDKFRDDSHLLPQIPYYQITAAGWIDYNRDGRPDLLLADAYHGLKILANVGIEKPPPALKPALGKWHFIGPFENNNNLSFTKPHDLVKNVDLQATWVGKGDQKLTWKQEDLPDGTINDLRRLSPKFQDWVAIYLFREIVSPRDMDFPISLGSDDTLRVWLNGKDVLAVGDHRGALPDQNLAVLKLKEGKNQLVLQIGQGNGDWGFYFRGGEIADPLPKGGFVDVSEELGLGAQGIAGNLKGDSLTIFDVNGDGLPDILFGAGKGMILMNTKDETGRSRFVEGQDTGLSFVPAKMGPVVGDFNGDGFPDLAIPQKVGVKLFQNDGKGKFTDVSLRSGSLEPYLGQVTSCAWGDFDNDGQLDLLVGCLKAPNRLFRNQGQGVFAEITEQVGLSQKIFNSQAVAMVDLNNDGMLDLVFNNEGQDSLVLLGNPNFAATKRTPWTISVQGKDGVVGSRVWVTDQKGQVFGVQHLLGGEGRGGQMLHQARFVLDPGAYRVHVRYSSGKTRSKEFNLGDSPIRSLIDEQTAKVD